MMVSRVPLYFVLMFSACKLLYCLYHIASALGKAIFSCRIDKPSACRLCIYLLNFVLVIYIIIMMSLVLNLLQQNKISKSNLKCKQKIPPLSVLFLCNIYYHLTDTLLYLNKYHFHEVTTSLSV